MRLARLARLVRLVRLVSREVPSRWAKIAWWGELGWAAARDCGPQPLVALPRGTERGAAATSSRLVA
ncbi:hypothetical protein FHS14_002025 [Paenibacillus baekrokdamisoli]|nr:hypothetical protein [Paenibacillus baekrokdamisoli]